MRNTLIQLLAAALLCAAAAPAQTASPEPEDAEAIVRRSVERSRNAWQALRDYTFIQTKEKRARDSNGRVIKSESETEEILILEGLPFSRLIARNGKPLSPEEQKRQQERMDQEIRKRLGETPAERQARLKEYEEARKRRGAILDEIPKAYSFRLSGTDMVAGRPVYVIDATPKPGYNGTHKYSKYLPKLKGRLWIDKEDYAWAKVVAENTETVSVGWVLARVQEGSRLRFEQFRNGNEGWFPERVTLDAIVRILLFRVDRLEVVTSFRDFRKFQADSQFIPSGGRP